MRNFDSANRRLQIVVRLRGSAAGFQHVRQRRQSILKPGFGGGEHGLRILQVRVGRFLQPFGVEQTVISLHDLENYIAVRVVELKIGSQQIAATDVDFLGSAAEVKHNVVENEDGRKSFHRLPLKDGSEENVVPGTACQRSRCHGGIQSGLADTEIRGSGPRVFPRNPGLRIILLGNVHQLG